MTETNHNATRLAPQQAAEADVYSERAVWLCTNRKTFYKTRIHGALAEILKKYPQEYKLKFLYLEGENHEYAAATGE